METNPPPEDAVVHRIAPRHKLNGSTQRHFADRATGSDTDPERNDPVTGDVSREHWIVPVHGLTRADPDGTMQAIAHRNGTVSLHLTCGESRTTVRFDVSRAAQLCTGIWEAAGRRTTRGVSGGDIHTDAWPVDSAVLSRLRPACHYFYARSLKLVHFKLIARGYMLSGVHVPLITPFDGGQVDFSSFDRLVAHLLDARPNGLIMFGTTGERFLISDQEAVALAKRTISAVSGSLPLTLAVGAVSTQEVVNQIRLFEDLEPAAYLVGSPFYVRPSQEDLIRHHTTVANATERPVLLYNIPFRSGVNLTNDSVLELATIDNVVGIKDVCGDLEQTFALLRHKPENFVVLAGQDPHYFASLAHGADGGVLASAHFRTLDFCHMTELLFEGALLEGRR